MLARWNVSRSTGTHYLNTDPMSLSSYSLIVRA